jgi:sugar phosphate isomerase/epimerase
MANPIMPLGVTAVMLPDLDLDEQIDLCRRVGVTHYTLRPRIIPEAQRDKPYSNWGNHKFDLTPKRLLDEATTLARKFKASGLTLFGTVPGATVSDAPDVLAMHFEGAARVGAGRVRVAPPPYPQGAFDYHKLLAQVVEQYRHAVQIAQRFGVKIVIETHCRSLATSPGLAWNICRHFDPQHLGVIFDIANFNIEGMLQPNLAVAVLGDYIDHCHVGGAQLVTSSYDALNCRQTTTLMSPLNQANLHIPSWIGALRDAGRLVPLMIENFTPNVPGSLRLAESAATLQRILASLAT